MDMLNPALWRPRTTVSEEGVSGSMLSKALNTTVASIWYRATRKETVDPSRGCALVIVDARDEPVSVILDRQSLLDAIESINPAGEKFELNPFALPPRHVVYLRVTNGKVRIGTGTPVVVMEGLTVGAVPKERATRKVASGKSGTSQTPSLPPTTAKGMKVATDSIVPSEVGDQGALSLDTKQEGVALTEVQQTLLDTTNKLKRQRRDPPLHDTTAGKLTTEGKDLRGTLIGDITWFRHHPHALSATIPPTSPKPSGGADDGSGSSKVAAFAIDGTLFETNIFRRGADQFTVVDSSVGASLTHLSAVGYRIVFFASYPSLHHGNTFLLQEKTKRIVNFCAQQCPSISPVVVLSTVSNFAVDSRFLMPNDGLWKHFIRYHNAGIAPSPAYSFYVGNQYDPDVVQSTTRKRRLEEAGSTDEEAGKGGSSATSSCGAAGGTLDTDYVFAENCELRFITHLDFYSRHGVPALLGPGA